MSFRCSNCHVPSLPKAKPTIVPSETRSKQYNYYAGDTAGVKFGTETVKEAYLCNTCVGRPAAVLTPVDLKAAIALGLSLQKHARKCNKKLADCFVCQKNMEAYASIPASAIGKVLEDVITSHGRLSLVELTLTAMIARTFHKSKRATHDFNAAFPVLKAYEQTGGKL